MSDQSPVSLRLAIPAFRAIAAAVSEAEIAGDLETVTISELRPNLQQMADALAVEIEHGGEDGARETWIVAGDGRKVAHLSDRATDEDVEGEDSESRTEQEPR
jgi:hypothetical protein